MPALANWARLASAAWAVIRLSLRISRHGAKLLSCTPKQTRLGRGAFMVWQTEVINERRELLARLRTTMFRYNPAPSAATGAGS